MKRNLILSAALISGSIAAFAVPLSPEEALARLGMDGPKKISAKARSGMAPVYTAKNAKGLAGAYVFNMPGEGYLILSADDVAFPVLGYGDAQVESESEISPELRWWLDEYSRQIEWAVENGANPAPKNVESNNGWTEVKPLLATLWNQDAPYNDMCPGQTSANPPAGAPRTYTGCVATSMAQVMKYFNYPEKGTGGVIYTPSKLGYKLSMRFADQAFDWSNMLNSYTTGQYTQEQADAVAYLMKCCGYSVNMNYGFDASGASGSVIGTSLKTYFKYDQNVKDCDRIFYTSDEWSKMVYDNLKNIGPVVMNGQSPSDGGHSFVCDGYDGKGYFHFNWGWGGVANGYYLLDALNPTAQGIGGSVGGFNFLQNAVLGIQPPQENQVLDPAQMVQYGSLVGSVAGNTLSLSATEYKSAFYTGGVVSGWYNKSDRPVNIKMGVIISSVDDKDFKNIYETLSINNRTDFSFDDGYGIKSMDAKVTLPDLPDGKYKVTIASMDKDNSEEVWIPFLTPIGYSNYLYLTKENGQYKVTLVPTATLDVKSVEIKSNLYPNKRAFVSVNVTNSSDIQLNQGLCPRLYSGNTLCFQGESVIVSLNPGETETVDWVTSFDAVGKVSVTAPTEYTLVLYNPETGEEVGTYGTVTMNPSPGSLSVSISGFEIVDATRMQSVVIDGVTYPSVMVVKDPADLLFKLKYTVKSGYFDTMLRMSIEKMENGVATIYRDDVYSEWQMREASSTPVEVDLNVDMSDADQNLLYALTTAYTSGYSERSFGTYYFMFRDLSQSGVEGIEMDEDTEIEYFNLQGQRVIAPEKGQIIFVKKGPKVEKVIF